MSQENTVTKGNPKITTDNMPPKAKTTKDILTDGVMAMITFTLLGLCFFVEEPWFKDNSLLICILLSLFVLLTIILSIPEIFSFFGIGKQISTETRSTSTPTSQDLTNLQTPPTLQELKKEEEQLELKRQILVPKLLEVGRVYKQAYETWAVACEEDKEWLHICEDEAREEWLAASFEVGAVMKELEGVRGDIEMMKESEEM